MSPEKTSKGGFLATLALTISIIALILAIIAFQRTGGETKLDSRIEELKTTIEETKRETTRRVDSIRKETANALERIGKAIKKE